MFQTIYYILLVSFASSDAPEPCFLKDMYINLLCSSRRCATRCFDSTHVCRSIYDLHTWVQTKYANCTIWDGLETFLQSPSSNLCIALQLETLVMRILSKRMQCMLLIPDSTRFQLRFSISSHNIATNATCKLNITWEHSYSLSVDSAQIRVFEQTNEMRLCCLLHSF